MLKTTISQLSPLAKIDFLLAIEAIVGACRRENNDAQINERYQALKNEIVANVPGLNWKDELLGLSVDNRLKAYALGMTSPIDAEQAIQAADPARFKAVSNKDSYVVIGSSFASTRDDQKARTMKEIEQHDTSQILDSIFSAVINNAEDKVIGAAIAGADGAGGHFDHQQDKTIANAARFACKSLVRFMLAIPNADDLKKHLPSILKNVAKEVKYKIGYNQEGSTLTGVRIFPDGRGVGVAIGDSMMVAYNPTTKVFKTLAPARQMNIKNDEGKTINSATAIFPFVYKPYEVFTFDEALTGFIVFPLTDGIWTYLPHIESEGTYDNGVSYTNYSLDSTAMVNLLAPLGDAPTLTDCVKQIAGAAIANTEVKRVVLLQEREREQQQAASLTPPVEEGVADATAATLQGGSQAFFKPPEEVVLGDDIAIGALDLRKLMQTSVPEPVPMAAAAMLAGGS